MENFAGAPVVRCRGGDSQARPRSGIRTAKSMPCTVPCARPLMCHCEEQSDVAISGRQLQPVQAIADRMQYCRGGDSRTRHCTGGKCGLMLKRQWPPSLSLRGGQRPTWQSREGSCDFAGSTLLSGWVLRDCTPRALPRASRSGRHVGLRPPRNDKLLVFTFYRQSLRDDSAAWGVEDSAPLQCAGSHPARLGRRMVRTISRSVSSCFVSAWMPALRTSSRL